MNTTYALLLILCTYSYMLHIADAAKILVFFPMPSKSHTILGEGVVKNLLKAGHEVTYVTPILIKDPPQQLHQVDVSSNMNLLPSELNIKNILDGKFATNSVIKMSLMFHFISKASLMHENVQALLNDPEQKFDLAIIEYMFNTIYTGLSQIYQCPFIWLTSVEPDTFMFRLVDESANPAYVPMIVLEYTAPLSFLQRANQLYHLLKFNVVNLILNEFLNRPTYNEIFGPIAEKRGIKLASLSVAEFNASLMLGNSHVSLGQATRLPQIYKPIGGYHIENNTNPLPGDLQKLMDNAKNGVIYFSMGSNLKSKDLPDSLKRNILATFGELKETVLWKFEEILPDLPKNVHILKWAPQQSILAHPNCKLFITHGGQLSTTEAVHFGVPIIGIPAFGDQFFNVHLAVAKGYAKEVPLNYDLHLNLKVAINEILSDPSYGNTAKKLSAIYHDRPVPPTKEMIHWVNHVIKHKGAPHLRSLALMVPWYQKMYLDLAAVVFLIIYSLYKLKKFLLPFSKFKKEKVN